jgi:hypothetical protein
MPPGVKIEGARGADVEASVCRVVAVGLDGRGVLTSRWRTGTRTPRGRKRHKRAQSEMVPRFRTGRLAFDGRDPSLLPTPRSLDEEKYIFPWVDSLRCVIPSSACKFWNHAAHAKTPETVKRRWIHVTVIVMLTQTTKVP